MLNNFVIRMPEEASIAHLEQLRHRIAKRNSGLLTFILALAFVAYYVMNYTQLVIWALGVALLVSLYFRLTFDRRSLIVNDRMTVLSMITLLAVVTWFGVTASGLVYYIGVMVYIEYVESTSRNKLLLHIVNGFCFVVALHGYWEEPYRIDGADAIELIALVDLSIFVLFTGNVIWTFEQHNQLAEISAYMQTQRLSQHVEQVRAANTRLEDQQRELLQIRSNVSESLRNARLTSARLAASREKLEQFTYAASHDLKEPIRTVRSFMQIIGKRLSPALRDDPEVSEYLHHVERSSRGMNDLLTKLLSYSRVGRRDLRSKRTDLADLVRAFTQQLEAQDVEFTISEAPASLAAVEVDVEFMNSVFSELFDNAVKFAGTDQRPQISVAFSASAPGYVTCTVSDTGLEVPAKYAERVFQLFARLHTRDVYAGSGIGLALVKRIVQRHGGEVWLSGNTAGGTTVHLKLPTAPAA